MPRRSRQINTPLVAVCIAVGLVAGLMIGWFFCLCPARCCDTCGLPTDCEETCLLVRFLDADTDLPMANVYVGIYINGTVRCQGYTDASGLFQCNLDLFGCGTGQIKIAYTYEQLGATPISDYLYTQAGSGGCVIDTGTGCCFVTVKL